MKTVRNNITPQSKVCLYIASIMIALLMILRDVGGVTVPKFIFIGIAAIVCFLGDKTVIYGLLAFIAPMAQGISYTYISAIALLCYLLKGRLRYKKSALICIVILLYLELFSAIRGWFSIIDYFRFASVFLASFLFMSGENEDSDPFIIVRQYIWGYIAAMINLFAQMMVHYPISALLTMGIRIGDSRNLLDMEEGIHLSYNPNSLGTVCVLAILFSVILLRKKRNWGYAVVVLYALLIGMTTQSKSFLVTLAVSALLMVLSSSLSLKAKIGAIGIGCVGWILANRFLSSYIISFAARWKEKDVWNGRIEIMDYYWGKMLEHIDRLLFGVGLQNYQEKSGYAMSAHNSTQEILITWGLVGLIVVVILFCTVIKNAHEQNPKAKLLQYIPFFAIILDSQSGQGFQNTQSLLWLTVAYSAILIDINGTKKKSAEQYSEQLAQDILSIDRKETLSSLRNDARV